MTARQAHTLAERNHEHIVKKDSLTLEQLADKAIAAGIKAGKFQTTFRAPGVQDHRVVREFKRMLQSEGYDVSVDWDPIVDVPEIWIGWAEDEGHKPRMWNPLTAWF